MFSMPIPPGPRCDCCGVVINAQPGDYCPRCGYPVSVTKEERFLEESIRNLQRVATYGGAQATVANLLQRYQIRYSVLRQQRYTALAVAQNAPVAASSGPTTMPQPPVQRAPISSITTPNIPVEKPSIPVQEHNVNLAQPMPQAYIASPNATNQSSVPPLPTQTMFSLRSFFADQTINIVASLGAFLILIGSLSFVVTTTNLFLAFIVVFLVHSLFAVVGLVFNRFSSFRFIARVYTAIFALLVPLVGFSGYRLVAGHFIQVSAPTVVAVAALYAALVYAFLAISQQFKPFGYLAVTALVLADLALAFSLHIYYWWWPVLLMPIAFAALLSVRQSTRIPLLSGNMAILREPMRVLMYACIAALCIDIVYIYLYSGAVDAFTKPSFEARFVGAILLFLLLVWTVAYLRTTHHFAWVAVLPYQFLAVVTAFAYVYNWQAIEYGLLFTAVAVFYHVGTLVARQSLQHIAGLRSHMEGIALVLVAIVPFFVAPFALLGLFLNASTFYGTQNFVGSNASFALLAILIGVAITVSMILSHTGFQRIPVATQTAWRWLLLLSGFLLTWAYSIVVLLLHISPTYAFLALTLLMLIGAIAVRSLVSVVWSNPLDVVVACEVTFTLLLNFLLNLTRQGGDTQLPLLLLFAVLSYAMMFYQRRANWLFLPVLFVVLAAALLWQQPRLELLLGVALPLVAVIIAKTRQPFSFTVAEGPNAARISLFGWEWPLLAVGLLCGVTVCVQDAFATTSTMQQLLGIPFSVALELAGLALIWYIVAVVARMKLWLVIAVGFAIVSLLLPSNSFTVLLYIPFIAALLAFAISRFTERAWGIPLYIVALLAAVKMGFAGYTGVDHATTATTALLGFALFIYVLGVLEDVLLFLWLAPCFALWSVFNSAMFGDVYRPLLIALVCAALGVGMRNLAYASTFFTLKKGALLRYSLPFYVTALAAAVLTGVYGMLFGSNYPFTAAIPDALFLYALVAYAVLVFERQPRWLWLVAAFAAGGTFLATPLSVASPFGYGALVPFTACYLAGVALVTGIVGMVTGRIAKRNSQQTLVFSFSWNWPWYLVSLLTVVVAVLWNYSVAGVLLPASIAYVSIFAFVLLTLAITLVEQRPTFLTMPIALAIWLVIQTHWQLWQQMMAFSILFFLVFVASCVWRTQTSNRQGMLYSVLGLGGQVFVLLTIMLQGGLSANAGLLGQVGAGVLLLLAVQLFWYGWLQSVKQHWTMYSAGLLVALAISWELSLLHQTRIEWLTLAPATYLIVVAPFLARDERVPNNHRVGQICSILGSALLLLPTLWSSFSEASIQPTFILAGEALFLLLLGVGTRVRFFVLSGAALVVVSAMHALFLPSLGLPPSLALTIMGVTLLGLATALSLARHRVQAVWTHLE